MAQLSLTLGAGGVSQLRRARSAQASSPLSRPRSRSAARVSAVFVEKMTGEQLEKAIEERTTPLVVDFYATWCGPCVMLSKVLEAVAQELGDTVRFVKVDTDEEGDLSSQLGIEALPTLIFIPSNKEKRAYRVEGMLPAEEIKRVLEEIA